MGNIIEEDGEFYEVVFPKKSLIDKIFNRKLEPVYRRRKTMVHSTLTEPYRNSAKISILPDNPNVSSIKTYYTVYKDEAPVRGAVSVTVDAITGQGWEIKTVKEGDVDKEDPMVIEVTDWLANPMMQFQNILRDFAGNLVIHDNAFLELSKARSKNEINWIYPLDTRDCEPVLSSDHKRIEKLNFIPSFDISKSNYDIVLEENDFVHAAMNAFGSAVGVSPIESLIRSVMLNKSAFYYNEYLFNSNGVPPIVFVLEEGSPDDFKLLLAQTRDKKIGESLAVMGKVTVNVVGGQMDDMAFDKLIEQVYQDVQTVFGVPPVMMCKPGASTLESSREETSAFAMRITAYQLIINNAINRAIIKLFGEKYSAIRFELKPWVNDKAMAAMLEIYGKQGFMTPNEVREILGLKKVEWGDVPYVQNFLGEILGERDWEPQLPAFGGGGGSNDKPKDDRQGQNRDQGSGRPAEIERPTNQGRESSQVKALISAVEALTKQNEQLTAFNEKLLTVVEEFTKNMKVDRDVRRKIVGIYDK